MDGGTEPRLVHLHGGSKAQTLANLPFLGGRRKRCNMRCSGEVQGDNIGFTDRDRAV